MQRIGIHIAILFIFSTISPFITFAATPEEIQKEQELLNAQIERDRIELPNLIAKWRSATDPKQKRDILDAIYSASKYGYEDRYTTLETLLVEKPVAEYEIQVPGEASQIPATEIMTFRGKADSRQWAFRRIAKNAVEFWTREEGWLFDGNGNLLNHVTVPRRDERGREWFGAFLPDGRYITSDLWDYDKSLYLFSKDNKYVREIDTKKLAGPWEDDQAGNGLVAWARADKNGAGWIVSVMTEWGEKARYWIDPRLNARPLEGVESWQLAYPHELGKRHRSVASDDGKAILTGSSGPHGPGADIGRYTMKLVSPQASLPFLGATSQSQQTGYEILVPGTSNNLGGFWIGSYITYIDSGTGKAQRLWFLDKQGHGLGWGMKWEYCGPAANGEDMLFRLPDERVVTLTPQMKVAKIESYTDRNGSPLLALQLYPELKLGLFQQGQSLMLGKTN